MMLPNFAKQRPAILGVRRPQNRLGLRRSPAPVRGRNARISQTSPCSRTKCPKIANRSLTARSSQTNKLGKSSQIAAPPLTARSSQTVYAGGGADGLMKLPHFAKQRPAILGVRRPQNRLGLRRSPAPVRGLKCPKIAKFPLFADEMPANRALCSWYAPPKSPQTAPLAAGTRRGFCDFRCAKLTKTLRGRAYARTAGFAGNENIQKVENLAK